MVIFSPVTFRGALGGGGWGGCCNLLRRKFAEISANCTIGPRTQANQEQKVSSDSRPSVKDSARLSDLCNAITLQPGVKSLLLNKKKNMNRNRDTNKKPNNL